MEHQSQLDDLERVRQRLNAVNYHDLKDLNLEFQDATGWQDLYGEFFFYAANSILGREPNLLTKCGGWPNLVDLHKRLTNN